MMAAVSRAPAPEPRERAPKADKSDKFEVTRADAKSVDDAPEDDAPDVDTATDDGTRSAQDLIATTLIQFKPPTPQPITPMPENVSLTTPIEQAVHQLLDQIQTFAQAANDEAAPIVLDEVDDDDNLEISVMPDVPAAPVATVAPDVSAKPEPNAAPPKGPTATVAVREPAPLPENPNPSHVHLVLDDGPERVVVTVAVRGSEVNVGIRGGDDQTAAAIARNAASLDHAMRARGLDLTNFTSERELGHDHREHAPTQNEDDREREETEVFRLEGIA